ncbi:uncharacterized protein [Hetaerina americana]|uniref:uncharacterized protein n=1 Tax=Hetaerina americana TaxID=62018 RepID=UPI003A7F10EF
MSIPPNTLETSPEDNFQNTILIPCSICGRTFKSESLQKHQAVCQKNASKKRRVFDSMKQRIQGTELAEYIPIPVVPPKPKLIPINKVAAKKLSKDDQRTGDSPNVGQHTTTPANTEKTPVRPTVTRSNSTGVHGVARSGGAAQREERCPHCDRTFGWKAFSRHEEWCREHKSRLAQAQSPAAVLKAKEMLEARIKYRAPSLGKSKRPTNREKYAGGVYTSPVVHSVHKTSVDDSPVISSMKATVSSSNKVVSESRSRAMSKSSTVQTSTAAPASVTPCKAGMGNAPRRGLSPSKKISRVIHAPWKPNINVDQGSGADENISPPGTGRSSSEEERGVGGRELTPVAQPNIRHSSYDPFSRAEMQLKELLSDGSEAPKQVIITAPPTDPEEQVTETFQNGGHEKPEKVSTKTNGSVNIHEIYAKQKQAKEVELPDLFTETSLQLNFEMPNVMRSRDRCVNTKRRALKPTAQNMGIELNTIGRDSSVGRRAAAVDHSKNIGNKFEDEEVEQITSIMDMGFCIPRIRDGNAKCNLGSELDIDSIHQSINLVALGLTNLSTHSQESLADKDNNNEPGGMRGEGVDFSGNVLKEGGHQGG